MKERLKELALKNVQHLDWDPPSEPKEYTFTSDGLDQFAQLIVQECIFTLRWHGFDHAVPYVEWMAKNKLGVKE